MTPKRTKAKKATHPRSHLGHFISRECPDPDCCGVLVYEGDGHWHCDGLVDPNDPHKELEACTYAHMDGESHDR